MAKIKTEGQFDEYGLRRGVDLGVTRTEMQVDRSKVVAVLVGAALGLTACNVTSVTPDDFQSANELKNWVTSWIGVVGMGVLFGAFTGVRAFQLRAQNWESREAYLDEIGKFQKTIEDARSKGATPLQLKQLERQQTAMGRAINPLFGALYVGKEAGEGFLAGAATQVAVSMAMRPDVPVLQTTIQFATAGYLSLSALRR